MCEELCTHCGLCCHYVVSKNGVNSLKRCKHLRGSLGNTYCCVYYTRLFRVIARKVLCYLRKNSRLDYPACPYNTDKPVSPLHLELYNNEINNKTKRN